MSDEAAAAIQARGEALALSFDDPAALAQKLAEWVAEHYPDRVTPAWWVTVDGTNATDKGFQIEVAALPWTWAQRVKASLGMLVGAGTIGAGVSAMVWQSADRKWSALAGVGAVSAYGELRNGGKWVPVVTFATRIRF